MSSLTGSSISGTYDQLLALPSGGGNGASLVALTDGNGGTTFALKMSTTALSVNATDRLYFDGGSDTYIHENSGDELDFVVGGNTLLRIEELGGGGNDRVHIQPNVKLVIGNSDTYFIENPDDNLQLIVGTREMMLWDQDVEAGGYGTITVGVDGEGCDFKLFGETSGSYMLWDQSVDDLILNNAKLKIQEDGGRITFGTDGEIYLEHLHNGGLGLTTNSALTSGTAVQLILQHLTSGTAANNIGNTIEFRCESAGGSSKQHAKFKAVMVNATNDAEDTDFVWLLMNDGASAAEKMRLMSTGNLGIGTSAPSHKLHVNGSARVSGHFMRTRNNVTIASGVADVTAGGFVNLQAESGTTDDLTKITINDATPDIGTELFLVADSGDTITIKTLNHSTVTDEAGTISCIGADADDSAVITWDEVILGGGYTVLHVVYNGRWCVMNPLVARCNNE